MNKTFKSFISNTKYLIVSQLLILVLGLAKALFLPRIIDVENFAYWQMYLLYTSYVGIFILGFNEGIYLRYGGLNYDELPKLDVRSGIRKHIKISIIFTLCLLFMSLILFDTSRLYVFIAISINIFVMGLNGIFVYIYQITNQMKRFSMISIISPVILIITMIAMFFLKIDKFEFLVLIDLIAKIITVIIMLFQCKDLVFGKISKELSKLEYSLNVRSGFKVMVGLLSGMLITGISRIIVDIFGSINDFAYFSFAINITNLVLVLVSSIGLVIYPLLKRINDIHFSEIYKGITIMMNIFITCIPLLYIGSSYIIRKYMNNYSESLLYLFILFSVIAVQSKIYVQMDPFYKALREEKRFLYDNTKLVLIYLIISVIFYSIWNNLIVISITMLIGMTLRCIMADKYLSSILNLKFNVFNYYTIQILVFTISAFYLNDLAVFIITLIFLFFYVIKSYPLAKRLYLILKRGVEE